MNCVSYDTHCTSHISYHDPDTCIIHLLGNTRIHKRRAVDKNTLYIELHPLIYVWKSRHIVHPSKHEALTQRPESQLIHAKFCSGKLCWKLLCGERRPVVHNLFTGSICSHGIHCPLFCQRRLHYCVICSRTSCVNRHLVN